MPQKTLFRLFQNHARSISEGKQYKISDEDRAKLAQREVTQNLSHDIPAIIDGLNRARLVLDGVISFAHPVDSPSLPHGDNHLARNMMNKQC
ncbi:hypothetical protein HRR83_008179 [Exophiala dermatitidis]|uniref:Uncharacterized protein n=1 Tax=Exophiala dermatitidis TaxID=5970 RepID=A0AAN6ERL2_EXODE|nr:hypothetical protein HRR74_007866 [Exophiala dermatitidis]KAJ4513608.1 hypothetical protein HRR73_005766 [Exophiala dermatitidis]KAJ4535547.1 hypothetical protein HRR77_007866 [Exophiala dermatitidis]KAJ4544471.1 hypothetical protein HRR76_002530 [Exophiala dermatitidis]KAJ4553232.1 hypothetical protein HRR79_009754 [Exophiala dermatitidis]